MGEEQRSGRSRGFGGWLTAVLRFRGAGDEPEQRPPLQLEAAPTDGVPATPELHSHDDAPVTAVPDHIPETAGAVAAVTNDDAAYPARAILATHEPAIIEAALPATATGGAIVAREPLAPPSSGRPVGPVWRVFGCSVRGAAHERAGLPNQDAIAWEVRADGPPLLILAVSDGHGSARCFRSDQGARFAVDAAIAAVRRFFEGGTGDANLSALKRIAEESLPQEVVRGWDTAVEAALRDAPLMPAELDALEAAQGVSARQSVEAAPRLAYGATILTVAVTEAFLLYLQIGDGDIITVTDTGEVERPLPADERLFANQTTSLSGDRAWREARVAFQTLTGAPPALILLSTDGYANSFRSEEDYRRVGPDLLALLIAEGIETVAAALDEWLAEASRAGSGDDTTLGVVCRFDALVARQPAPVPPAGETAGGAPYERPATAEARRVDRPLRARAAGRPPPHGGAAARCGGGAPA